MISMWEADQPLRPSPATGYISKFRGPRQLQKGPLDTMFALRRMRRKLDILNEDFRRSGSNKRYDIEECIALLDIIEERENERSSRQGGDKTDMGDGSSG